MNFSSPSDIDLTVVNGQNNNNEIFKINFSQNLQQTFCKTSSCMTQVPRDIFSKCFFFYNQKSFKSFSNNCVNNGQIYTNNKSTHSSLTDSSSITKKRKRQEKDEETMYEEEIYDNGIIPATNGRDYQEKNIPSLAQHSIQCTQVLIDNCFKEITSFKLFRDKHVNLIQKYRKNLEKMNNN